MILHLFIFPVSSVWGRLEMNCIAVVSSLLFQNVVQVDQCGGSLGVNLLNSKMSREVFTMQEQGPESIDRYLRTIQPSAGRVDGLNKSRGRRGGLGSCSPIKRETPCPSWLSDPILAYFLRQPGAETRFSQSETTGLAVAWFKLDESVFRQASMGQLG